MTTDAEARDPLELADRVHGFHAGLPVQTLVRLGLSDELLADGWTQEELDHWSSIPDLGSLLRRAYDAIGVRYDPASIDALVTLDL